MIVPKRKILLIEEEVDLQRSITITLRRAGYDVVAVSNGNQALYYIEEAIVEKDSIDLIITDLNFPGLSGIELIDNLRSRGVQAPFAVLTAYGNNSVYATLREKGCIFCLDKPFNSDQLEWYVSEAFKGGKDGQENLNESQGQSI